MSCKTLQCIEGMKVFALKYIFVKLLFAKNIASLRSFSNVYLLYQTRFDLCDTVLIPRDILI